MSQERHPYELSPSQDGREGTVDTGVSLWAGPNVFSSRFFTWLRLSMRDELFAARFRLSLSVGEFVTSGPHADL